ncbi:MAG: ABC transporter ATP-binding protein [Dermatophilaceae bacterium]
MQIVDLSVAYEQGGSVVPVVSGLSFDAEPGRVTALVGPSGAGKSSVLRVLAGIQQADSAMLEVDGPVALVYQDSRLVNFLTVSENLALAADLTGAAGDEVSGSAILARLGLAGLEDRMPLSLSGGERHRVALARAVVMKARTLLVDEPTAALDRASATGVAELLRMLARSLTITMVVATHDPLIFEGADHVVNLGRVARGPKLHAE